MAYFIGWDVGGWNCDKNSKSRDAIVILDSNLNVVGMPWRGNLTKEINDARDAADWIGRLFSLCRSKAPAERSIIVMAIDTPLGFPDGLVRLAANRLPTTAAGASRDNPYLFRATERFLSDHGLSPLSAIKDMIGSQATKGIHTLARFVPKLTGCGAWTNGDWLSAIEAYPSSCKASSTICSLRGEYEPLDHPDKQDALTCALIAYLYSEKRDALESPGDNVPTSEGWIWVPKDALKWN